MKKIKKLFLLLIFSFSLLLFLNKPVLAADKLKCNTSIFGGWGIKTAIGCIPISENFLDKAGPMRPITFLLKWGIGVGGGIAFLLIVYAGFQIMTSQGNPDRLKGGQELLTSAIAGIILLIFSAFILRVIGVNIFEIPGFGN